MTRSKTFLIITGIFVLFGFRMSEQAQDANSDWMRVQSDDGEFSIEVPTSYKYYPNSAGFITTAAGGNQEYLLKNMRMFTSFENGSLLSFEVYEANRGALEALFDQDSHKHEDVKVSTIKNADFSIKQIFTVSDDYYCVRRFFYSKNNIYILTAASREGETASIKRFFDSLEFDPDSKATPKSDVAKLSSLKATEISVGSDLNEPAPPKKPDKQKSAAKKKKDKNDLIILTRPRPSYVESARHGNVQGTVRIKANFEKDGFMPEVVVLKKLPEGLLRQALIAAIRIRFLPKIENGKPVSAVKLIEYEFDIF